MLIKGLIDEDFINYKKPAMYVAFPNCSFKCEKECGIKCCQNSTIAAQQSKDLSTEQIVNRYLNNPISQALICSGLEPFDSWKDLQELIEIFRSKCADDIIIYTGYNEDEIKDKLDQLKHFPNIIIKVGRFIPNQTSHKDNILGVTLASDNQYAIKIS